MTEVQQRGINAHVRFSIILNTTGVLKLLHVMRTVYFVSRRLLTFFPTLVSGL